MQKHDDKIMIILTREQIHKLIDILRLEIVSTNIVERAKLINIDTELCKAVNHQ